MLTRSGGFMTAPFRICIVSGAHPARNPRVVKEATALADAGHDVEVLTVASHRPSLRFDAESVGNARWRLCYGVDLTRGGFVHRLCTRVAREAVRRLGLQPPEALGPVRALLKQAQQRRADLFIVHTEPGLWVGGRLLDQGRRVVVDFEDWHSEDLLPQHRSYVPLRLLRGLEKTLLMRAAYSTTTSEVLADALHVTYGGNRPVVISNSAPLSPLPDRHDDAALQRFFWFSQTLGPGRGLEAFVDAWSRMSQPSQLTLLGNGAAYAERLLARLPVERRANVVVQGPVPPGELPAVIARHDIGLALEVRSIRNRDLAITNKILQYLNAGLAVVATRTAGQRETLAHRPDAGIFVDLEQPALAAAALDTLVSDRKVLSACQAAARQLAEERYCWELEAPRLVKCVESILR